MPDDSWVSGAQTSPRVLRSVRLLDGSRADVHLASGRIAAVVHDATAAMADGNHGSGGELDLSGYLLLPAPVEPHAHLDRALLAEEIGEPLAASEVGAIDLAAAVAAVRRISANASREQVRSRAQRALAAAVAYGIAAVRTHVDCHADLGDRAVSIIASLRAESTATPPVQIVAMAGRPITGRAGAPHRAALADAMASGADLVGGAPSLEAEPDAAIAELAAAAREAGCGLDLHLDESIDPTSTAVLSLLEVGRAGGFAGPVTASHLISLGQLSAARVRPIAHSLAALGVGAVTLPHTSLYLQDRGPRTPIRRGLTALAELRAAGVRVAAGSDNWRDPFNPFGFGDPLRTAALLAVTAHISAADAYAAVSTEARSVLGLPQVTMQPGSPADLLAVRGTSLSEVLATATADRVVFRGGELIARTTVATHWA